MALIEADPIAVGEFNWSGEPRDADQIEDELRKQFENQGGLECEHSGALVVALDDGTRIGTVSWRAEHWAPPPRGRCFSFGIGLLPEHRGHGYGTHAQRLLVDHLFQTTDTHRVQSDTAVENTAEHKSLLKVGLSVEGIVRQAEYRDGSYHDHTLFSILRPEWEASHGS